MICDVIKIGTSRGIRLPATLLKEFNNPDSFEIEIKGGTLTLVPKRKKRARVGWDKRFKEMHSSGDDKLIIDDALDIDIDDI